MDEILFKVTAKKMSMESLGDGKPTKFKITLEVPLWFGKSIIRLIKTKVKEYK